MGREESRIDAIRITIPTRATVPVRRLADLNAMSGQSTLIDAGRWKEIDQHFHRALEVTGVARAEFLQQLGMLEPILREEVQRLLDLHERTGEFLECPDADALLRHTRGSALDSMGGEVPAAKCESPKFTAGDRVGRFRLVRLLDSGGMGDVWLADRDDDQFQQTVAIKLFRAGLSSVQGVERFLRERQTLARLEHPSIARLIDGGTTDSSVPFLVMEFVDGTPIDQSCTERKLNQRERVELFRTVCEAVHFAHQNLVIHRDLKPANILVTRTGRPKLLDFGIAQELEETQPALEMTARAGARGPFTIQYASPEQISGGTCTTASDVYSLGVIFHQLLSGKVPHADNGPITRLAEHWSQPGPTEGDANSNLGWSLESPATSRLESSVDSFRDGDDLEWIVRKALQHDPTQRYTTAKEFSDDLARWLDGYPVLARSGGSYYRSVRFVRRNRILSMAVGLIAVTLIAATIATSLAWRRARAERDTAQTATRFIGSILTSTSPFAKQRGGQENTSEVLESTSRRATVQLRDLPEVELQVRIMLAQSHASLWQWSQVLDESRRAMALITRTEGISGALTAQCLALLGRAQTWLGHREAIATQERALAIRTELYGPDHADVAESSICLGFAKWKVGTREQISEADVDYSRGIETYRRIGVSCSSDYARALFSYASFCQAQGREGQLTQALVRESVSCYAQLPDAPDRYSMGARTSHAHYLLRAGDAAEARAELSLLLRITPVEFDIEEPFREALWTLGRLELLRANQNAAFYAFRRALRAECMIQAARGIESRRWRLIGQMFQATEGVSDLLHAIQELVALQERLDDADLALPPHDVAMAATLGFSVGKTAEVRDLTAQLTRLQQRQSMVDPLRKALLESVEADVILHSGQSEQALNEWTRLLNQLGPFARFEELPIQPIISGIVRANEALGRQKAANQYRALLYTWE